MSVLPRFLDVPDTDPSRADVLLLALPYEGTVSHGRGTAQAPTAIWTASQQVELWDEELDWDLDSLAYHTAQPVVPEPNAAPDMYQLHVHQVARRLHQHRGLVVGVGGEHSVTPALLSAACQDPHDASQVTVVQIDAHADLRDQYGQTRWSHACAMRRVLDLRATVVAIGIRSAEREEFHCGRETGRVRTYFAQRLAEDPQAEPQLLADLGSIRGDCYVTIDMDGLSCELCPGTGTPQPGGLGWWQTLRYLRALLRENRQINLIGADVVETVPQPRSQVNEMAAAKILAKVFAYHFDKRIAVEPYPIDLGFL